MNDKPNIKTPEGRRAVYDQLVAAGVTTWDHACSGCGDTFSAPLSQGILEAIATGAPAGWSLCRVSGDEDTSRVQYRCPTCGAFDRDEVGHGKLSQCTEFLMAVCEVTGFNARGVTHVVTSFPWITSDRATCHVHAGRAAVLTWVVRDKLKDDSDWAGNYPQVEAIGSMSTADPEARTFVGISCGPTYRGRYICTPLVFGEAPDAASVCHQIAMAYLENPEAFVVIDLSGPVDA